MALDEMWDGFAAAIVRIGLRSGTVVVTPRPPGDVGSFPLTGPLHVVTACNPDGLELDDVANAERHRLLGDALVAHEIVDSIGSAPDGTLPEPGYGVFGLDDRAAVDLGRRFGQRAIYRWTADALAILGVDEDAELRLGWSLS